MSDMPSGGHRCGCSAPPPASHHLRPAPPARPLSTLRLVCKRWKRIFDGSTRLAGGRLVLQAEYDAPSSAVTWDVAALVRLAACRTGVVQDAQVRQAHRPGRLEAVRQLTALTSLVLTAQSEQECRFHQPGQELAQRQLGLGTLPQLRRLMLDAAGLLEPSCQQLSAARHLTSLVLGDFLHEVSMLAQLGYQVRASPWKVCRSSPACAS